MHENDKNALRAVRGGLRSLISSPVGRAFLISGMVADGGPGSGNFNHEGRPGEVGGSGPGGGEGGSSPGKKNEGGGRRTTAQKLESQKKLQDLMTHSTLNERKEAAPEVAGQFDDMPAGSEMTAIGDRGVRTDYRKNEDGTWTSTYQDYPAGGERQMSSRDIADEVLNTHGYSYGQQFGLVIRNDGSNPDRDFDASADAKELKSILPDCSDWKRDSKEGQASEILDSVPDGTYVALSTKGGKRMTIYKKTGAGTWENAQSIGLWKYSSSEITHELYYESQRGDFDVQFAPSKDTFTKLGRSLTK